MLRHGEKHLVSGFRIGNCANIRTGAAPVARVVALGTYLPDGLLFTEKVKEREQDVLRSFPSIRSVTAMGYPLLHDVGGKLA